MCEQKNETATEEDNNGDKESDAVNDKEEEAEAEVWFVWKPAHKDGERCNAWIKKEKKRRKIITAAERWIVNKKNKCETEARVFESDRDLI